MNKRSWFFTIFGGFLIVCFQNCGSIKPTATNADPTQSIQPVSDKADSEAATKVLVGYHACSSLNSSERSSCESKLLREVAKPVELSATTCIAYGPLCESDRVEKSLILRACIDELKGSGMLDDQGVAQLATADSFGFAEKINSECLFAKYRCVMAVRCKENRFNIRD